MIRWAFFKRCTITGRDGSLYMRRWRLIQTPWFALYLHKIVRSDAERHLHDHPWNFWSFTLKGGYNEVVSPSPGVRMQYIVRRPFSLVRHKAEDLHRVMLFVDKLVPGGGCTYRTAWTLVWCGRRRREWGFQTEHGWVSSDQYQQYQDLQRKLGSSRDV